jgi:uncharacterized protein YheU (UPF0270 family)
MRIPPDALSADALVAIIEAFVLREGTDYGERETGFATKCLQVRKELDSGRAAIEFDQLTESVNIVPVAGR